MTIEHVNPYIGSEVRGTLDEVIDAVNALTDGEGGGGSPSATALEMTVEGSFAYPYPLIYVAPRALQLTGWEGTFQFNAGPWIESFNYSDSDGSPDPITSLTFDNLIGVTGGGGDGPAGLEPNLHRLLTFGSPTLQYAGRFAPSAEAATAVSFPALVYAGSFSSYLPAATSLDFTALRVVNGNMREGCAIHTSGDEELTISFPALELAGNFGPAIGENDTLSCPALTHVVEDFNPTLAPGLPMDFTALRYVGGTFQPVCSTTGAVDFALLGYVGGGFSPGLSSASSVDFSSLATVGSDFDATLSEIGALDLPALTRVGGAFEPNVPSATTLGVPLLASIGNINLNNAGVVALSFPSLTTAGGISITNCGAMTSLDLSAFESTTDGAIFVTGCGALTTVTFGALTQVLGDVNFDGCALNEATVDAILVELAALDGTGGTTSYNIHTITLSGGTSTEPSVTGLAAKVTLEGRGCEVIVNS